MFGLHFLFVAALWALPLAGLPVLLHMLFRRKSPVVFFSTLRFIKSSIQHTAARRRIQRWILLACRVLLLTLLIWALAQPVKILASGWFDTGRSTIAAIVVDTSYSMQLKQQEITLLDRANDIALEMLRDPLKESKVAIFRSSAVTEPEQLEPAAKILSEWANLKPQPAPLPLAQRCADAISFLSRQQAGQKWLVILSDMQSREFPTPLAQPRDIRTVLFDLHPERPVSNGITSVRLEPEQPIPGVGTQAVLEITGQAGDVPFANLNVTRLDGTPLKTITTLQGSIESTGRCRLRIPVKEGLPLERWLLIQAGLQREDDLPWDNTRSQLVELPAKQAVTFIAAPSQPAASTIISLALDPWKGARTGWPIELKTAKDLTGREQVAVLPLTDWPDAGRATRLANFARNGGIVILLLQPGLEQTFEKLPDPQKHALRSILPAPLAPTLPGGGSAGATGRYRPVPPLKPDRVLEGLTDPSFRLDKLSVSRFVPFGAVTENTASTLLHLSPAESDSRAQPFGLLYRRTVGSGTIFTFATLPENRYLSPPTHPLLLPLLVGMCLRPPEQRDAQNVEIGQSLILAGTRLDGINELEIERPGGERQRVPVTEQDGRKFVFSETAAPGLHRWRKLDTAAPIAIGNVQLPAAESELIYKPADAVARPGPNCLVVRSFSELRTSMAKINEPQPRWTMPIVIVLILLCAEALLGSMSQLWKPLSLRGLLPSTESGPSTGSPS